MGCSSSVTKLKTEQGSLHQEILTGHNEPSYHNKCLFHLLSSSSQIRFKFMVILCSESTEIFKLQKQIMKISLLINATLLAPNIPLSTLFSNTLNICSSTQVTYHISNPCKTTQTQNILNEMVGNKQCLYLVCCYFFINVVPF